MSDRPADQDDIVVVSGHEDVLTDALVSSGFRSRKLVRSTMRSPWRLDFRRGNLAFIHVMERGRAHLLLPDRRDVALKAGEVVILIGGGGHSLVSDPGTKAPVTPVPNPRLGPCVVLDAGGTGAVARMLCGAFVLERGAQRSLSSFLPELVHLRAGAHDGVAAAIRAVWNEASSRRLGHQTAIRRLTDLLFIQVVRAVAVDEPDLPRSWLTALGDERIALSITAMHESPATKWTVGKLADTARMSRSPFASRFAARVGSPPLTYLTQLRMHRSMALLREGRKLLSTIAREVGYGSATAFSKVFRRFTGTSPRAFAAREVGRQRTSPVAR